MVLIPKSLNHTNITDKEIRAYYSLTPRDEDYEIHEKRFNKIIKEYMTNQQKFKSKNAEYSFKKRMKSWAKDPPQNSKVWDAFMSWRLGQINRHIAKQRDSGFNKEKSTDKESKDLICQLRRELAQKDMIIKGLTEENNQLKSHTKTEEIVIEEVKEEVKEEVNIYGLLEDTSSDEDLVEEVSSDEEEEVKEEDEIITGLYETCETLEEATELYDITCDKKTDKLEKLFTGDNLNDLKNDYFNWLLNERENLDGLHDIDMEDPLWNKLIDRPLSVFTDNLNTEINAYYSD